MPMNTALLNALKEIVSRHGGVETLSDTRRVKALLADLAAAEPKPHKNALTACLEQGFAALLQQVPARERGTAKTKLVERLNPEEGLDMALCADTLDLLEAALLEDVSATEKEEAFAPDTADAVQAKQRDSDAAPVLVSSDKDAEMVRLTDEIERLTNERNQSNDENRKNEESLKKTKAGVYATIFIGFISIISIAVMHYYKGDYAHARADWEKVLRINPSDKVVQGDLESLQRMSYLSSVPDFVNDAYIKASEDMLIGIGTYKIGADASKMSTGMIFAQTRARADIARQLDSIIKNMIADYVATSKLDPTASLSFQESVAQALSKADLKGAKVVASQIDSDGLLWVVMEYSKSAAVNDYSAATAAGKLAVPAAAAFDPLSRMDACFSKAASGGPVIVGD